MFDLVAAAGVDEEVYRYVKDEHLIAVALEVLTYDKYSVDDLLKACDRLRHTELDRVSIVEVNLVSHGYHVTLHILLLYEITTAVTLGIVEFL